MPGRYAGGKAEKEGATVEMMNMTTKKATKTAVTTSDVTAIAAAAAAEMDFYTNKNGAVDAQTARQHKLSSCFR